MRYGFGILSLLGALSRDAAADVAPTWQYGVHIEARQPGIAEIELRIQGASARAPKRVCLMMEGAGRYLDTPRSVERGVEHALLPDKHDEDCWTAPRALRVVRYRARLAEMADALGDWDWASRVGDDYVLRDGAILVHPDPPPPDDNAARFLVRFELPAGASEATPWRRLDGEAHAYALDSRQYREGSYLAIGKLRSLGDVTMSDGLPGVAAMTILDHPHRTTDEDLVRWVQRAASLVARFYGELPGGPQKRTHVILIPAAGSAQSGIFGSVLRRGAPSVVLLFGADATGADFEEDWVATHELFHLGNPTLEEKKLPWLVEGFTTYYQDVLRGRRGAAEAARMWGDLYDGCHRFGDPEGGVSLEEESRRLRESHNYPRVYWGGACLALRLDVAIRERSGNTRSLDDVMRDLRRRSAARPFTAARILDELARETGDSPSVIARTGGFARAHLRATRPLGLDELYRRLGLEPTGSASVKLLDDAPLAPIRRGIF